MNAFPNKPLSRRAVLRGAGACIALPFLDAMLPSRSYAAPSRFQPAATSPAAHPRMIFCYVPHGVSEVDWYPTDTGPNWTLSPTLKGLEEHKSDFTLLSGLCHPQSIGGHEGADTWLTGADLRATPGKDYQNTVSVDQVAAELHGKDTRLPSLELSNNSGTGSALHSTTLAFDRLGTPLPAENSPQRLFERLFVPDGAASREATLRRYNDQSSILDEVLGEARSLHKQLGKSDQRKLDEYLGAVRESERRVQRLKSWIDVPKPQVDGSQMRLQSQPGNGHDRGMWLDVMLELCYLAFHTDTTRVITFQWLKESDDLLNHHNLSHHGGDPQMLKQLADIDRMHIGELAHLLRLLKSTKEGNGTMLDNTMVLYGSGMSNGKGGGHSPKNLPLILAGGRNLGLRRGRHLKYGSDSTPMSNVLLTMLQKMGVEQDSFMDSTGTLSGVL